MLFLLCATVMTTGLPQRQPVDFKQVQKPRHELDGSYKLYWDDSVDGQCINSKKVTNITFKVDNNRISGEFLDGLESGKKAKLTGRIDAPKQSDLLVVFRQEEPGYVASYQLVFGPATFTARTVDGGQREGSSYIGVWHDTKGRSGDFILSKYQ